MMLTMGGLPTEKQGEVSRSHSRGGNEPFKKKSEEVSRTLKG